MAGTLTTRWNCAILNIRRVLPVDGVPRGVYKEVTVSLGGLAVTSLLLSVILFEQGNNRNYAHTESKRLHPCNHSVSVLWQLLLFAALRRKAHPRNAENTVSDAAASKAFSTIAKITHPTKVPGREALNIRILFTQICGSRNCRAFFCSPPYGSAGHS